MNIWEIILIGLVLATDAFSLTIANCATYKTTLNRKYEWAMPIAFSLFQFLMPVLGFYLGNLLSSSIVSFADYIPATVFFVLSMKIVIDNVKELKKETLSIEQAKNQQKNCNCASSSFSFEILFVQAIATSIDAFVIGITFAVSPIFSSVFVVSAIIGVVTFVLVSLALFFGKYLGKIFGCYAQWVGAIILFALAIKSLIEALL